MDPASAGRWLVNHPALPRSLATRHQRPGPGLRQAHRCSVLDQLSVV